MGRGDKKRGQGGPDEPAEADTRARVRSWRLPPPPQAPPPPRHPDPLAHPRLPPLPRHLLTSTAGGLLRPPPRHLLDAPTAGRPAEATAAPSSDAAPKERKRPAEAIDSPDDLIGRWVGIPTEHFQVESGGGRYLGHVTSRRGKSDSVWFKCEGGEYHDHYTKVREWLISDEERTAVAWYKDSMDTEAVESAARSQESRDTTRSRAHDQPAKRSRPNTVRVRASTPAAAHQEDFGADFDGGVYLD